MERSLLLNLDLNLLVVLDVLLEERHVTRSAKRLYRSQSAVSHALNRLRIQLDDPLLIRSRGQMQLSAKAQHLQPLLRQIMNDLESALSNKLDWEPETCTRHFSLVGPDFTALALPHLLKIMEDQAPLSTCELCPVNTDMFHNMTMGRYDLLFFRNVDTDNMVINDPICTLQHVVFMRRGHPALEDWGLDAWLAYPHVRIRMVGGPSPVDMRLAENGLRRRQGPVVSSFLMTPPIVASTNAVFTAPYGIMKSIIDQYDIVVRACPIPVADIKLSLFSSIKEPDPARQWFHRITHQVLREAFDHSFEP